LSVGRCANRYPNLKRKCKIQQSENQKLKIPLPFSAFFSIFHAICAWFLF
jgi:hypothetical protein